MTQVMEEAGWLLAASYEDADYEWEQVDVWWHPAANRVAVYADSGCSCNGPYEDFSPESDLDAVAPTPEAVRALVSRVDRAYRITHDDKQRFAADVRRLARLVRDDEARAALALGFSFEDVLTLTQA